MNLAAPITGREAWEGPAAEAAKADLRQHYSATLRAEVVERVLRGRRNDLIAFENLQLVRSPGDKAAKLDRPMTFCLLGTSPAPADVLAYARDRYAESVGKEGVDFAQVNCGSSDGELASTMAEFAIIERVRLVAEPTLGLAILDAVAANRFAVRGVTDATAFGLYRERLAYEAQENLAALREGRLTGVGMLIVANPSTKRVCGKGDDPSLLRRQAQRLNRSISDPDARASLAREINLKNVEDLFDIAKKNLRGGEEGCHFIVGDHSLLRQLLATLQAASVEVSMAPLWIGERNRVAPGTAHGSPPDGAAAAVPVTVPGPAEPAAAAPALPAITGAPSQSKAVAGTLPVPANMSSEEQTTAQEDEVRQRRQKEPILQAARRAATDLADQVRVHLSSIRDEVAEEQKPSAKLRSAAELKSLAGGRAKERLDGNYGPFTDWAFARLRERYAFDAVDAVFEDYGAAEFMGKKSDAVSINMLLSLSHPARGQLPACWTFTWISDSPSKVRHLVVQCAEYASAFRPWSNANKFASTWKEPLAVPGASATPVKPATSTAPLAIPTPAPPSGRPATSAAPLLIPTPTPPSIRPATSAAPPPIPTPPPPSDRSATSAAPLLIPTPPPPSDRSATSAAPPPIQTPPPPSDRPATSAAPLLIPTAPPPSVRPATSAAPPPIPTPPPPSDRPATSTAPPPIPTPPPPSNRPATSAAPPPLPPVALGSDRPVASAAPMVQAPAPPIDKSTENPIVTVTPPPLPFDPTERQFVLDLQHELARLKCYDDTKIDGRFGPNTAAAVKDAAERLGTGADLQPITQQTVQRLRDYTGPPCRMTRVRPPPSDVAAPSPVPTVITPVDNSPAPAPAVSPTPPADQLKAKAPPATAPSSERIQIRLNPSFN